MPNGVEISADLARLSNELFQRLGGRCIHDNAIQGIAHFDPDFFQLIVLSSFLEHEEKPLQLLRACCERLKSGGRIMIKVPNYASLNRHMRGARWCGFRWPEHVNYFTPRTLRMISDRAGLKVVRMNFFDRFPFSDSLYAVLARK